MIRTGTLAGKTLFVTGASRGIGKAIAERAAKDGANVIIAAKTATPHPKLPGTIYTAAEELERAGGKCLPCVVDIRHESEVEAAVEEGVKKFGGIDILVNNASAINLTGTGNLPMKSYDLMHSINARGTYLCSKICLPYLMKSDNPHILNISPPLLMESKWFANHVAYTMAKYGMSMCVLGMAEEFKDLGIAVNALWPKTAIYTAAMEMLGGYSDETKKTCRTVDIMSDAAHVILTKSSRSYTGNFAVDEDVMREAGVTDFTHYACVPGHPLQPDFFLNIDPNDPTFKGDSIKSQEGASAGGDNAVSSMFKSLSGVISEDLVQKTGATFQFDVSGGGGTYYLDLKNGAGSSGEGALPSGKPDVTFTMDSDVFVKMFKGEMKATTAFMGGKLKIKGDMGKAMKLETMMKTFVASAGSASAETASKAASGGAVPKVFETLSGQMNESLVESTGATFQFELSGDEEGVWYLDLKNASGSAGEGAVPSGKADVTFSMTSENFLKMFKGELKATTAFMGGKLKIKGDMGKAMKLEKLMSSVKSKL